MTDELQSLKALLGETADLKHAADLIEWDERVYMPDGGATTHGEMLATLRRLAHERFTSDEVGAAIDRAARSVAGMDADDDAVRTIAVAARDYAKATQVPAAFVAEHATVISAAQHAWVQARAAADFALFQPHLERVLELKRRYVTFFGGADHPYDLLLDEYEPGMKTADVQAVFAVIRPRQVELIRRVGERPAIDDGFLKEAYAEREMWDFAVDVITAFGFDWACGRQDKSVHPFATSIGASDVRITTRWVPQQPLSLLFGTMHEAGHALYEQGVSAAHHRTSLEGGASLGIHESQSRLWENLVGRSLPFWEHFFPPLQARFPAQLGGVTLGRFYQGINRVQRSLIRVEADEATYNLHIMLRVELEIALIEGSISAADLPELWSARMQEYLGLTPTTAATGVLQDIHWSAGLFGYFATYTLGNLVAAQLWQKVQATHPSLNDDIRRGDFTVLLAWLRSELHQHGRKYQPQELVTRITGTPIDPEPYLHYLEQKYGDLSH
jgi:carboxypeptidase Taq